ncbi:MAG: hemin uptake protein HemP [Cyanobacteria bacterium P01_F01_bin.3]
MTESKPRQNESAVPSTNTRQLESSDLFRGHRTVVINHAGEQYRLLITKNDKLILQK